MNKPKSRAALFARYSSKLQDALSLEAQVTEMERFCDREGLSITHRFLLPETRSANVERADEFQAMMRAAKRREFDVLVLHKLDRFGRDRETTVVHKAILRRHGVRIVSVSEPMGESIHDRMVEGFLEIIAEFYSANLGQETRKGQRAATRAGRFKGGKPLWGYNLVKGADGNSILEPDPERAPIVLDVFRRYVAGDKREDILSWVQSQTGELWTYTVFQTRIRNATYKGELAYGKTHLSSKGHRTKADPAELVTGSCAAIVPVELWEEANRRMGSSQARNRRARYPYLLTQGLAVCALCGRGLVGAQQGGNGTYPYYLCPGWRDRTCERQKSFRAEKLEAIAIAEISKARERAKREEWQVTSQAILDSQRELFIGREKALNARLSDLSSKEEALLEFIMAQGSKAPASVSAKLQAISEEREETYRQLETVRAEEDARSRVITEAMVETIGQWFRDMDEHEPGHPAWKRAARGLFMFQWNFSTQRIQTHLLTDQFKK